MSRRLFAALVVVVVAISGGVVAAGERAAEFGGAPPQARGTIDVTGFVRVIDGSSFEVLLDGRRAAVGVIGIETSQANTGCGQQAISALQGLVRGGVRLEEDPGLTFDSRGRRMYRVLTRDGRLVAEELVSAGVARPDGTGADGSRLAAARAKAQAAGAGCADGSARIVPERSVRPSAVAPGASSSRRGSQAAPAAEGDGPTVPSGFIHEVLATGFFSPAAMTVLPDGRVLVAEKSGVIWVYKNGAVLSAPFANIMTHVNDYWDRGFVGIAPDKDFAQNGYIYLLYTYEHDPDDIGGPKTGRLTRVTMVGDEASPSVDNPAERVVLGMSVGDGCGGFPSGADCLPSEWVGHTVGGVRAAPDGTLFVSVGDASNWNVVNDEALRTQNLDVLAGKIMRVSTSSCSGTPGSRGCGKGVSSNPFWNGNADANRSKVWALGARNVFRFSVSPLSGTLFAPDVGWGSWEEVNTVPAGANLGWPCYEGAGRQPGYESKATCQSLYGQGTARGPLVAWDHNDGLSTAVLGGPFYTATVFPSQYQNALFFADYGKGKISYLKTNGTDQVVSGPTAFASDLGAPTQVELGPDGALYYIDFVSGELRRIRYSASSVPTVTAVSPTEGATGVQPTANVMATFSLAMDASTITSSTFTLVRQGTTTPVSATITYDANTRVATLNPAATLAVATTYVVTVKGGASGVKSSGGTPLEQDRVWTFTTAAATNTAPVATISAPAADLKFSVGENIAFSGGATDAEDGSLTGTQLRWRIIIHHCPSLDCHVHDLVTPTGAGGSIVAPDHGDGMYLEFILTATDSGGLTDTKSVSIHPRTTQITIQTSPSGLQVIYGGETATSPLTRTTIVGSVHTVNVPSPQNGLVFSGWSDGGSQEHNVTVGSTPLTVTATFAAPDTTPPTISGARVVSTTSTTATLAWSTNEPADSAVEYGPTTSYGATTPIDPVLSTGHTLTVTGLTPSTTYHFRVRSRDAAGNLAVSADLTQVTISSACSPRPGVSVVTAPDGPGRLRVTATVSTSPSQPTNSFSRLRLVRPVNARIDVVNGPTGITGDLDLALAPNTKQVTFIVHRITSGSATTVPFVLVDNCGDWSSLAGGGSGAF